MKYIYLLAVNLKDDSTTQDRLLEINNAKAITFYSHKFRWLHCKAE
jgi:hypothetical protein